MTVILAPLKSWQKQQKHCVILVVLVIGPGNTTKFSVNGATPLFDYLPSLKSSKVT